MIGAVYRNSFQPLFRRNLLPLYWNAGDHTAFKQAAMFASRKTALRSFVFLAALCALGSIDPFAANFANVSLHFAAPPHNRCIPTHEPT